MKLSGRVVKKPFAQGTKSARSAVILVTSQGEYVLRRLGGNAFSDPVLDSWVGHELALEGELHGYTFIVSGWEEQG